ncbi:MAG: alpha-L-rhamnosidase C-terminal domain-containing protein [Draconibacterium sp.]
MRFIFYFILTFTLFTGNIGAYYSDSNSKRYDFSASSTINEPDEKPFGFHVETVRNCRAAKIIAQKPHLGWIVPSELGFQTAYHILVASSKDKLQKNTGDIWDSGKVKSSNSSRIQIQKELQANTNYYWKVKITGSNNQAGRYSDVHEFSTGDFDSGLYTSSNFFVVEEIQPSLIRKNDDGSYFFDFGKDAFSTLSLKYKPLKEETLIIRLGEKLKDGRIDQNPGGTIRYQQLSLDVYPGKEKYEIQLVPDQRNTASQAVSLPDSFPVLLPFRYAEIDGFGANFDPTQIIQKAYFNYFDDNAGSFSSSDTILNQVWDLCKYSIKATSFTGYYIDGDRERIPYEADAYLNQLSHYAVDNEYTMARKTIEYFMQHPTWPTEWQLHVVLLFFQDYMYTGNTTLIEKYYEQLKYKTLMNLEVGDGFISTASPNHNGDFMAKLGFQDTTQRLREIVDWPQKGGFGGVMGEDDGFVFKPINTVVNAMYYGNMKIMAEFAGVLGKNKEKLDFEHRAEKVKAAINQKLYNKTKGCYYDGMGTEHASLHANMFALVFGLVPQEYQANVIEFIKTRGMACSVYGAQYLMEALYNAGAADYALDLLTATHDRSWYNMIKVGSTITMEAWDMKYKPNSDWNHAWGAVPANIISRNMWGVEPTKPGFEEVTIKPQLASLKQSSIVVPTIRGAIKCNYKKENDKHRKLTIEIPGNMHAAIFLGDSNFSKIMLNGKTVQAADGSLILQPGENFIEVRQ